VETTRTSYDTRPPTQRPDPILAELRAMRAEQQELRRLLDTFMGTYLNARFPYGKHTDRWARRG
jgi:hypothetical protein